MLRRAPRPLSRLWHGPARGALLALCLWLPAPLSAEIAAARYTEPTDRYPHAVLGDAIEHAGLEVTLASGARVGIRWPDTIVFEDIAPRVVDVTGDGAPEVIVVESHDRRGARLAVYGLKDATLRLLAATDFIGTRFRWLAVVGAADLDGDGAIEIAYVDRPHLAKTLRVWRVVSLDADTTMLENAGTLPGVTNHRIGEDYISGGIRDCGGAPEMIVADASWTRILAVTLADTLETRDIGPFRGRASIDAALTC
ncbi:MAG: VCBS repeat-containing protein [Pseudomonadota bacterium]